MGLGSLGEGLSWTPLGLLWPPMAFGQYLWMELPPQVLRCQAQVSHLAPVG